MESNFDFSISKNVLSFYYSEIILLLITQVVFGYVCVYLYNKYKSLLILLPLVFIPLLGYFEFLNFQFKLPNYDEHRVPLNYQCELIDGEFGCYLNSTANRKENQDIYFYDGRFNISDSLLTYHSDHPDSSIQRINLITLKKTPGKRSGLHFESFAQLADKHQKRKLFFLIGYLLLETLSLFTICQLVKRIKYPKA